MEVNTEENSPRYYKKIAIITLILSFCFILVLSGYLIFTRKQIVSRETSVQFSPTITAVPIQKTGKIDRSIPYFKAVLTPVPVIPYVETVAPSQGQQQCSAINGLCGNVVISKDLGESNKNILLVFVREQGREDKEYQLVGYFPSVINSTDTVMSWKWNKAQQGKSYETKAVLIVGQNFNYDSFLTFTAKYLGGTNKNVVLPMAKILVRKYGSKLSVADVLNIKDDPSLTEKDKLDIKLFLDNFHWYPFVNDITFFDTYTTSPLPVVAPDNNIVINISSGDKAVQTTTPVPLLTSSTTAEKIPECYPIVKSGSPDSKHDVILLANKFSDINQFIRSAQQAAGTLKSTNLSSNELGIDFVKKMNFTAYTVIQDFSITLNPDTPGGTSIGRWNRQLAREKMSHCGGDSYIIIDDFYHNVRAVGSYAEGEAVVLAEDLYAVPHELGHSIAGLDDEYIYEEGNAPLHFINRQHINCTADATCQEWKNKYGTEKINCSTGCSYGSYYRATTDSIMKGREFFLFLPITTGKFNRPSLEGWRGALERYSEE